MRSNLNISIFGLGYVGLPLAVKLSNYFNVLGFDKNKNRIKELKNFLDINNEINFKELIYQNLLIHIIIFILLIINIYLN